MNPELVRRAAKLIVVPCHYPNLYHVAGGSEPHLVKQATNDSSVFFCDCKGAAKYAVRQCSHRLSVMWYLQKQSASLGAEKAI